MPTTLKTLTLKSIPHNQDTCHPSPVPGTVRGSAVRDHVESARQYHAVDCLIPLTGDNTSRSERHGTRPHSQTWSLTGARISPPSKPLSSLPAMLLLSRPTPTWPPGSGSPSPGRAGQLPALVADAPTLDLQDSVPPWCPWLLISCPLPKTEHEED